MRGGAQGYSIGTAALRFGPPKQRALMPNRSPSPAKFDLNGFSSPFRNESARGCAVLGGALVDERLKSVYGRCLQKNSLPMPGSFAARIQLALTLAWIDEDAAYDLHQVREIRNVFAHLADHELTFDDPEIATKCNALGAAQSITDGLEHAATAPRRKYSAEVVYTVRDAILKSPRQKFEMTVEMLAQHLDELPIHLPKYQGPSMRRELWDLGARFMGIQTSRTATQLPAPQSPSISK